MNKKRGIILTVLVLLIVVPLIYAGNYGSGVYSAGDYGVGEVPASPSEDSTGGGGGGSSSKITYECSIDSDCKENQFCLNNKCYNYTCYSDADCNMEEGETCLNHICIKLFDIKIIDLESPIKLGTEFEFTYFLKGMADISDDVEVHFWIEKDNKMITSGHDTIYIGDYEEKTETTRIYLPTTIDSGLYTFFVQLIYRNYKVNTHRTIEIIVDKEKGVATIVDIKKTGNFTPYLISALIGFVICTLFFIFYWERKKIKAGIIKEAGWIEKHKVSVCLAGLFIILGILTYVLNSTGIISLYFIGQFFAKIFLWFENNLFPSQNKYFYHVVGSIIGLIILIVLGIIARKKHLIERFKSWKKEKSIGKKKESRRLMGIATKKTKSRVKKFENFKEFAKRHRVLFVILGIIIVCCISVGVLFYRGLITTTETNNVIKNILDSIQNAWQSITSTLKNYAIKTGDFVGGFFLYIIACLVGLVILLIGYFKREVLRELYWRLSYNFEELSKKQKIVLLLILVIIFLVILIYVLFYYEILSIEKFSSLFSNVGVKISEFRKA